MQTQYQKVREFMQAFGQECPERTGMPGFNVEELRADLIDEEAKEFRDSEDIISAFDAVLDLLYVVMGAGIAYGISEEQIAKGLAEVHRSNMSKMWTAEELLACDDTYLVKFVGVVGRLDRPYVVTNTSGKIIKSPSYSKANLGPILEGVK